MGKQQRCFWSYTGLEFSLNCLVQPLWGSPELNLNLCKSHSCTHTVLNWLVERSREHWNWWKCLLELANGRKEVLPVLEAANFSIVSVTAERWSCFSDLGGSPRLWGAVLNLTLREHPVEAMVGQRRRGRSCSSVIPSLALILCWY